MIKVTRLDGTEIIVNSDMIEFVEATPDTILTLTDGKKVIVEQDPDDVVERIIHFRNRVMAPLTNSTEQGD
ncbi:flagellar FlbD family protein [bacterium]|nr:flagellar FlbD family protein [bacterium]